MPKKALQTFAKSGKDGLAVVVSEEDVFADDHPYVKAWPEMFGDLADLLTVQQAPKRVVAEKAPVEQATAAPGEVRRGPGRPRKDS